MKKSQSNKSSQNHKKHIDKSDFATYNSLIATNKLLKTTIKKDYANGGLLQRFTNERKVWGVMQKKEFEKMAKIEVTDEVYETVIQPMYLATNLSKADFIKVLNLKALTAPQIKKEKNIRVMLVRDNSGFMKTPNGCYYHIEYVELVDVEIRTGKFIVKPLEDEDFQKLRSVGSDLHLGYHYDFDYTQCLDTKKKPIRLVA